MASSFQISATVVTFVVDQDQYTEHNDGPLRSWDVQLYLSSATDFTTLRGLRSWLVTVTPIPGGTAFDVDIGAGAGAGTLTIDNNPDSPFTAVLTHLDRPSAYPGGGRRARATFQQTA